jgi:UDP-N-acetylmuramyl pentapeptide synthase
MLELGDKKIIFHEEIADYITNDIFEVLLIGKLSYFLHKKLLEKNIKTCFFQEKKEISEYINKNYDENYLIFLKGSRSVSLEKIIELL